MEANYKYRLVIAQKEDDNGTLLWYGYLEPQYDPLQTQEIPYSEFLFYDANGGTADIKLVTSTIQFAARKWAFERHLEIPINYDPRFETQETGLPIDTRGIH